MFDIKGKVTIVTGAASGIGLETVRQLLIKEVRGVVLVDINEAAGNQVAKELQQNFGADKVVFVKADVSDKNALEEVFKRTLDTFKNVDILINNAGIIDDLHWEKMFSININAVVNGTLLALEEYINKHKSGDEGVILNTSSLAAVMPNPSMPLYAMTKSASLTLTRALGVDYHYQRTKVRVMAICPGITDTPMFQGGAGTTLGPAYTKFREAQQLGQYNQSVEHVAKVMVKMIEEAPTGAAWSVWRGGEPTEIKFPTFL